MHHRLFANQAALNPADLPGHAQAISLDAAAFQQCLDSGRQAAAVRKDLADGQAAGVTGTPAFFIGVGDAAGKTVKVLRSLKGAQPFTAFKAAIDELLSKQGG